MNPCPLEALEGEKGCRKQREHLSTSLESNIRWLRSNLLADDATIVYRLLRTKGPRPRDCALVYANNMAKHDFLSEHVVAPLMSSAPEGAARTGAP